MRPLDILFVGDGQRAEFRSAWQSLHDYGRVTARADVESAAAALAAGKSAADVIVIAQPYAGRFSAEAVDCLRRLAPLARVIALLGSWCEGEMRSGQPWPGVVRVYWHQWRSRGERELRNLLDGRDSTWRLPVTASDEDRLLAAAESPAPRRQGLIAIQARRGAAEQWLSAACAACGYATAWRHAPSGELWRGVAAAIFDGTDFGEAELEELRRLAAALPRAPILALADFPRLEDRERILAAGAAAVLSKPLLVEDLWWELQRVAPREADA